MEIDYCFFDHRLNVFKNVSLIMFLLAALLLGLPTIKMVIRDLHPLLRPRCGSILGGDSARCPFPIENVSYDKTRLRRYVLTSPRRLVEEDGAFVL